MCFIEGRLCRGTCREGKEVDGRANGKTELWAQHKVRLTNCPGFPSTQSSSVKTNSLEKTGIGWAPYLSLIPEGTLEQESHHRVVSTPKSKSVYFGISSRGHWLCLSSTPRWDVTSQIALGKVGPIDQGKSS